MHRRRLLALAGTGGALTLAGCLGGTNEEPASEAVGEIETDWPTGPYNGDRYATTTVAVRSESGTLRGAVRAVVPQSEPAYELGLSVADSLPAAGGFLYTYESVGERSYDMQDMSFGLDFVFADGDRTITAIRNAPAPGAGETGTEQQYAADGQYVLAVGYEWTDDNDVAVGDRLQFEL